MSMLSKAVGVTLFTVQALAITYMEAEEAVKGAIEPEAQAVPTPDAPAVDAAAPTAAPATAAAPHAATYIPTVFGGMPAGVFAQLCGYLPLLLLTFILASAKGLKKEAFAEWTGTLLFCYLAQMLIATQACAHIYIGFALMALIYAHAGASGGHLNPAVSLGLFLAGKIDAGKLVCYWCAQFSAACGAALLAGVIHFQYEKNGGFNYGQLHQWHQEPVQMFLTELLATCFLVFTVLMVAAVKHTATEAYGLAIGATVIGLGTVATLNPAISLTLFCTSGLSTALVHIVAGFIGACLAYALASALRGPGLSNESMDSNDFTLGTKLLGEAIGTFYLMFNVAMAISCNSTGGKASVALALGATVLAMAYAIGPISGGHFNPAISYALGRKSGDYPTTLSYILTQMAAAVVAILSYNSLVAIWKANLTGFEMQDAAKTEPTVGKMFERAHYGASKSEAALFSSERAIDLWRGVLGEFMGTFIFALIVLCTATRGDLKQFAPIAIGFGLTIAAGSCIWSGGEVNPAVAVAFSANLLGKLNVTNLMCGGLYVFFQLLGAEAAVQRFNWMYGDETSKEGGRRDEEDETSKEE